MADFSGWPKPPRASLSELAILVSLIAIFIYIAANRIWELRVIAEKTGMEHTIAAIHSALGTTLATVVVREGVEGIASLDGTNPMNLLDPPPSNYIGELETPVPSDIEGPAWYYDLSQQALVYRVLAEEQFLTELSDPPRARFRLQLSYEDLNGNGRYDSRSEILSGLKLTELEPYSWKLE